MADQATWNRLRDTRPLQVCFLAVVLVVFSTAMVLIQRPQVTVQKVVPEVIQSTDLQNEISAKILDCLQQADTKTYQDFMVAFSTPSHPCSFISLEPLVSTLGKMLQQNNSCSSISYYSRKELNSSQLCQSNKLLENEPDNSLRNGQTVHEFMKLCGAHAPKLVSFPGRTMKNRTVSEDALPVPNIVHYVWFGNDAKFTFLNHMSFLGVHKYIQPDAIYLHGDTEPNGEWWSRTLKDVSNVYFVYKPRPTHIFGKKIKQIYHSSDIARFEILNEYGGIYLDTDVLVVKSFDPLRKFDITLGRENPNALSNGIIIARRGARFFRVWIETYRTFKPNEWGEHSVTMAGTLQKIYPTLVHVEEGTLVSPDYRHRKQVFQKGYDWSKNYAVHIWKRHGKVPTDVEGIKKLDNLLGELMRYIYFGSKNLVK